MADPIRLNNEQFDYLIQNAKKEPRVHEALSQLNEAELTYMRGRVRANQPAQPGQSAVSQARLATGLEAQMRAQGPGAPPETSLLSDTMAGVKDDMGYLGQQALSLIRDPQPQFSQQDAVVALGGGAMVPPFSGIPQGAQESVLRGAMNVVPGVANALAGMAQMVGHMAGGVAGTPLVWGPVGKAAEVASKKFEDYGFDSLAETSKKVGDMAYVAREWGGAEAGALIDQVVGMVSYTWDLGREVGKQAVWLTPVGKKVLTDMGVTPPRLLDMVTADPVAVALTLAPVMKAGLKARAAVVNKMRTRVAEARTKAGVTPIPPRPKVEGDVTLVEFRDNGQGLQEAYYKLNKAVGKYRREGDVVPASELFVEGVHVPVHHDRRVAPRDPAQAEKFFGKLAEEMNNVRKNNPEMSVEEYAHRSEEIQRVLREQENMRQAKEGRKARTEVDDMDAVSRDFWEDPDETVQRLHEAETRMQDQRQPGQPRTAEEIAPVMASFRENLGQHRQGLSAEVNTRWEGEAAAVKEALLDEAELARPDMTREQLRQVNDEFAETGMLSLEDVYAPPEVAWLVNEVARARATRGSKQTPLTTPNGPIDNAKVVRYDELGKRTGEYWKASEGAQVPHEAVARGERAGSEDLMWGDKKIAGYSVKVITPEEAKARGIDIRTKKEKAAGIALADVRLAGEKVPPLNSEVMKTLTKTERNIVSEVLKDIEGCK
jgi:hypothetical protein